MFAGGGVVTGCIGIEIGGGVRFALLPPAPNLGPAPGGTLTVVVLVPVLGDSVSSAPQPTTIKSPALKRLARTMRITTSTDDGRVEPKVILRGTTT